MVFKIIQNLFNNFYTQTTTPKNSKRPPQPRIIGVGERVWHKLLELEPTSAITNYK